MADESVKRDVLLNLKLLADDANKQAAESVRSTIQSLVEDMEAGYQLAREAAIKEAKAAGAGQIQVAKQTAEEVSRINMAMGQAKTPPGTSMPAAMVNPGGPTGSGTATMQGAGGAGGGGNTGTGKSPKQTQAEKDAAAAEKAFDREAAAAVKAYSRIMKEREKAAADAEKQFDREANEAVKAYSRIMRERDKLNGQLTDALEKQDQLTGQATKNAAEGLNAVVKMGRGFAELGILSEESSEAMLKGMIRIQAGFDIITGGIDLYVKLQESIRIATKALQAQAAAQAALNALQLAGGKAAVTGGATTAATMGGRALGVLGTGAAGAGAVTGGGSLMAAMGTTLTGLASAAGLLLAKFVALPAVLAEVIQFFGRLAGFNTESIFGAFLGMRDEQKKAAASDKALAGKEKERENRTADINRRNEASVDADELQRSIDNWSEKLADAQRSTLGLDKGDEARMERDNLARGVGAANAQVEAERAKREEAKGGFRGDARAGEDLARQRAVEAQEKLLDADKRRVAVLRDQQKTQEQQVKTLRDQLQQAEKLAQTERDSYKSTLAKLGALSEAERRKVQEIGKKLEQGGEMTEAEARFLQGTGLGSKKTDEFFANKALKGGGDATLDALGEGQEKLKEAEAERDRIARELADAEAGLQTTTTDLNDAVEQLKTTILETVTAINAALKFTQEGKGVNPDQARTVNAPAAQVEQRNPELDIAAINAAAAKAAETQQQLTDTFVAALDNIAAQNREQMEEIKARQTRGALNQQGAA